MSSESLHFGTQRGTRGLQKRKTLKTSTLMGTSGLKGGRFGALRTSRASQTIPGAWLQTSGIACRTSGQTCLCTRLVFKGRLRPLKAAHLSIFGRSHYEVTPCHRKGEAARLDHAQVPRPSEPGESGSAALIKTTCNPVKAQPFGCGQYKPKLPTKPSKLRNHFVSAEGSSNEAKVPRTELCAPVPSSHRGCPPRRGCRITGKAAGVGP